MSDLEKMFGVLVSPINYKVSGMECTRKNRKILALNSLVKEAAYLETEIFKSFFGEDLGKKEFFLEAESYENIIEEYENTLRTLLEKEHKVPKEYYNRLEEYKEKVHRNLFTDKEYTDDHFYDEIHEILGEYYVLQMRFPTERISFDFNEIYYLKMKSFYDNGDSLYISTALNYKELGF
jgi:hypothetical protein